MSGHSKWATIKHKKGAADKARGKLFAKLIRQVEVAAREGGGDPDTNPTLAHHVPEGTGELGAARHHRAGHQARGPASSKVSPTSRWSYEGYAPSGVAIIVECLTDKPQPDRAGAAGSTFSKNGGSMAEPGAVAWQFERKGVILVPAAAVHRG